MLSRSTTRKISLLIISCLALAGCKKDQDDEASVADPMAVYEQLVAACKAKDAESLWLLLGAGLRGQIGRLASDMQQLGAEALAEVYGYKGKLEDFDGKAYLAGSMKRNEKFSNVCYGAEDWKVVESGQQGDLYVVAISRPDDLVQGVKLKKMGKRWVVFDITKPRPMPK